MTLLATPIHLEAAQVGLPALLQGQEAAEIGAAAAAEAALTPQARERMGANRYSVEEEAEVEVPLPQEVPAERLSLAAPAAPAE